VGLGRGRGGTKVEGRNTCGELSHEAEAEEGKLEGKTMEEHLNNKTRYTSRLVRTDFGSEVYPRRFLRREESLMVGMAVDGVEVGLDRPKRQGR
jgi:hypothetical protein